ncbi:uncharacterized protein [Lolium perenne]|uniref:uncharacterized protein isoform X1 n=2 Tax=Lolium perenne TaxID=4522 RepID=UPI0021F62814|nr:uncharacterized protein LOC127314569 isoform X1 [Lolium perenne]
MYYGRSTCFRTRSGLVRGNGIMDPSKSSGSRTRSGLVRRNNIIADPSEESCSKTRSGLVRVKNIVDPSEGSSSKARHELVMVNNGVDSSNASSSRTRSGLARVNNIVDSSEGSQSKTRSGLVRRNIAMDSNGGSCSKTRSGLVRGNIALDFNEDSSSKTRSGLVGGKTAIDSNEDSCSKTRSGLVRISPSIKVENKDEPVIKSLPGERCEADSPGKHGSNQSDDLVLIKNAPVIKGPDGCLGEVPVKDQLNYKADQVESKDEPVMKGPDGWWKEEVPRKNGSRHTTDLVQTKDELDSMVQLPDGWLREARPRKNGTTNKLDTYYIDPASGYEFRSLKDVQRYVESGDINKCSCRPKKRTIQDVCVTQNQAHTRASSEYTRPGTADKAIQCEILTSEGIMLPREELFGTYTGNAMLPEFEGIKPIQKYANKVDPLEHKSAWMVSAQRASGGKKSVKRKEPSAEVKPKKRKITSKEKIATPPRASSRIAALKVYPEGNAERGDEPTSVNLVNQVQPIQEETTYDSQFNQADTIIQVQTNQKSIANQLQSSQADTVIPMQINDEGSVNQLQSSRADALTKIQTKQDNTTIHVQFSQADTIIPTQTNHDDTVNQLHSCQADTAIRIQTNQESTANQLQASQADTANQMHAMQEYTTSYSQVSKADTMNRKKTNQGNTARQLQSSNEKILIPVQAGQEYVSNHSRWQQRHGHTVNPIQANQEHATNQLKSSQADSGMKIQATQYFANHSEPRQAGTALNHMQINQETIQLQLGQADTMKQMQTMQQNSTNQLIQALTVDKKRSTHEYFTNHPKRSQSDNVNHMQISQGNSAYQIKDGVRMNTSPINQGNSAYQKQSQRVNVNNMQISQGNSAYQLPLDRANSLNKIATQENTTSRSQLIQGLTVNQIQAIRENNTRYLQPRYAENPIRQSDFSQKPEWGHGAPVTNFWQNVENQKSSNPVKIEASPTATSSANFQRQYAPAQEPVLPTQAAMPEAADPSGFGLSLFGSSWSDPCIEFAFKTLTGDIPVLDDSPAVRDHFPLQHDLNKIAPPDYSAPSVDDTRNTQFDHAGRHSAQRPSDRFYNGGWFPPQ